MLGYEQEMEIRMDAEIGAYQDGLGERPQEESTAARSQPLDDSRD